MRWKTNEIISLLTPFCASVTTSEPGGDVDTTGLQCIPAGRGDAIYVSGFNTTGYDTHLSPDDIDVEMVEVTDGMYSDGGLNSQHLATAIMYGQIVATLRQAGFDVVPSMRAYF